MAFAHDAASHAETRDFPRPAGAWSREVRRVRREPEPVKIRSMVGDGEIRYAEHRGAQLAFRTWGDGPPLIYVPSQFIPVAAMDEEPAHERFLHALASFATLIVFDRRGVGLSDPMDGPPTIDDWAGQVEAVITGAGFDDAYVLGHGAGGMPASTLAATRPRRVRGLILAMAFGRLVLPPGAGIEQAQASARPNEEAPPIDFLAQ